MEQTTSLNQPQLDKLASSLAKAQAEFPAVKRTGRNPHLKNEYSTLDDVINAVRKPLANHGLAFVQLLGSNGEGTTTLRTILLHESGQSLESTVVVDAGGGQRGINALQALGAAITYMKRYSLSAMLGISTDGDTDGNGAEASPKQKPRPTAQRKPDQTLDWSEHASYERDEADNGDEQPTTRPQKKRNGKPASVKTSAWSEVGKEFAKAEPYYQKDGAPDWYHMTGAAAKCGFSEITDDNISDVLDALRTHAHKMAEQQEMELEA